MRFAVQRGFWDRAESLAGRLLSKASELFGGLLAPPLDKPDRAAAWELLGVPAGTLFCPAGTARLRRLDGAVARPVVAGHLELFGVGPLIADGGDGGAGGLGVFELRVRARGGKVRVGGGGGGEGGGGRGGVCSLDTLAQPLSWGSYALGQYD